MIKDTINTISINKGSIKTDIATISCNLSYDIYETKLAADVRELRNILKDTGYDKNIINRQLQELIRQNKATANFLKKEVIKNG